MEPKYCRLGSCRKLLVKRSDENTSNFRKRIFCGIQCRNEFLRRPKEQKKKRKNKRRGVETSSRTLAPILLTDAEQSRINIEIDRARSHKTGFPLDHPICLKINPGLAWLSK